MDTIDSSNEVHEENGNSGSGSTESGSTECGSTVVTSSSSSTHPSLPSSGSQETRIDGRQSGAHSHLSVGMGKGKESVSGSDTSDAGACSGAALPSPENDGSVWGGRVFSRIREGSDKSSHRRRLLLDLDDLENGQDESPMISSRLEDQSIHQTMIPLYPYESVYRRLVGLPERHRFQLWADKISDERLQSIGKFIVWLGDVVTEHLGYLTLIAVSTLYLINFFHQWDQKSTADQNHSDDEAVAMSRSFQYLFRFAASMFFAELLFFGVWVSLRGEKKPAHHEFSNYIKNLKGLPFQSAYQTRIVKSITDPEAEIECKSFLKFHSGFIDWLSLGCYRPITEERDVEEGWELIGRILADISRRFSNHSKINDASELSEKSLSVSPASMEFPLFDGRSNISTVAHSRIRKQSERRTILSNRLASIVEEGVVLKHNVSESSLDLLSRNNSLAQLESQRSEWFSKEKLEKEHLPEHLFRFAYNVRRGKSALISGSGLENESKSIVKGLIKGLMENAHAAGEALSMAKELSKTSEDIINSLRPADYANQTLDWFEYIAPQPGVNEAFDSFSLERQAELIYTLLMGQDRGRLLALMLLGYKGAESSRDETGMKNASSVKSREIIRKRKKLKKFLTFYMDKYGRDHEEKEGFHEHLCWLARNLFNEIIPLFEKDKKFSVKMLRKILNDTRGEACSKEAGSLPKKTIEGVCYQISSEDELQIVGGGEEGMNLFSHKIIFAHGANAVDIKDHRGVTLLVTEYLLDEVQAGFKETVKKGGASAAISKAESKLGQYKVASACFLDAANKANQKLGEIITSGDKTDNPQEMLNLLYKFSKEKITLRPHVYVLERALKKKEKAVRIFDEYIKSIESQGSLPGIRSYSVFLATKKHSVNVYKEVADGYLQLAYEINGNRACKKHYDLLQTSNPFTYYVIECSSQDQRRMTSQSPKMERATSSGGVEIEGLIDASLLLAQKYYWSAPGKVQNIISNIDDRLHAIDTVQQLDVVRDGLIRSKDFSLVCKWLSSESQPDVQKAQRIIAHCLNGVTVAPLFRRQLTNIIARHEMCFLSQAFMEVFYPLLETMDAKIQFHRMYIDSRISKITSPIELLDDVFGHLEHYFSEEDPFSVLEKLSSVNQSEIDRRSSINLYELLLRACFSSAHEKAMFLLTNLEGHLIDLANCQSEDRISRGGFPVSPVRRVKLKFLFDFASALVRASSAENNVIENLERRVALSLSDSLDSEGSISLFAAIINAHQFKGYGSSLAIMRFFDDCLIRQKTDDVKGLTDFYIRFDRVCEISGVPLSIFSVILSIASVSLGIEAENSYCESTVEEWMESVSLIKESGMMHYDAVELLGLAERALRSNGVGSYQKNKDVRYIVHYAIREYFSVIMFEKFDVLHDSLKNICRLVHSNLYEGFSLIFKKLYEDESRALFASDGSTSAKLMAVMLYGLYKESVMSSRKAWKRNRFFKSREDEGIISNLEFLMLKWAEYFGAEESSDYLLDCIDWLESLEAYQDIVTMESSKHFLHEINIYDVLRQWADKKQLGSKRFPLSAHLSSEDDVFSMWSGDSFSGDGYLMA